MIQISTSIDGRRHIVLPRALAKVAMKMFAERDMETAVFKLARSLTGDDLHTLENIADVNGDAAALEFASKRRITTEQRFR